MIWQEYFARVEHYFLHFSMHECFIRSGILLLMSLLRQNLFGMWQKRYMFMYVYKQKNIPRARIHESICGCDIVLGMLCLIYKILMLICAKRKIVFHISLYVDYSYKVYVTKRRCTERYFLLSKCLVEV